MSIFTKFIQLFIVVTVVARLCACACARAHLLNKLNCELEHVYFAIGFTCKQTNKNSYRKMSKWTKKKHTKRKREKEQKLWLMNKEEEEEAKAATTTKIAWMFVVLSFCAANLQRWRHFFFSIFSAFILY